MDPSRSCTIYFLREVPHASPDHAPALRFLNGVPASVAAELMATIDAVAAGPPPSFRGGGRYRTMHGSMTGWHEARTKHGKDLYRIFCLHDRKASGLPGPALVLVAGGVKPSETAFPETFYPKVRTLGKAYLKSDPRHVLR
jgi:hypothetical protein